MRNTVESMRARTAEVARLAGLGPGEELAVFNVTSDASETVAGTVLPGCTVFLRFYRGREVIGSKVRVFTDLDGNIVEVRRTERDDVAVESITPTRTADEAARAALAHSTLPEPVVHDQRVMIFATRMTDRPLLVWRTHLRSRPGGANEHVLTDAHTNAVVVAARLEPDCYPSR